MTLNFLPVVNRFALTVMAISGAMAATATVHAADTSSPAFISATASDGYIRAGVKAFKRGQYAKTVTFQKAALKSKLSPRKAAIAQSNLCAAYGAMGEYGSASEACETALTLRPDYAPALSNKAALRVEMAKAPTLTSGGQ